ncbi:lipoprotein-anchoring transpeptidase ErfK/SrfK [Hoeflea halophila]|uniref:Lipoprotein-anchoring transpeptidase ErfK/SrfK n=2 Tax=Hoeflea halophila TaxID=714899 RepID=A0A286IE72_9HYPH|nr:lipoprotein-anchoring transpeptidase ErfK/SrfK [Hoeflea halophila]
MTGAALSLAAFSGTASAGERYGQRPPVVLSPDLTAPWVMQLRGQAAPRGGVVYRTKPKAVRSVIRQPRTPQVHRRQVTNVSLAAPRVKPKPAAQIDQRFLPQTVAYSGSEKPGTIIINTSERYLYHVMANGQARRYGVGVGKEGHAWSGTERITRKAEWPDWRPPAEMIKRVREKEGRILPAHMKGGPENPLGARALYLGSTLYRIHGTNQPWTIGKAVSSGCIRMRNEDVTELYENARVGAKVIVL